MSKDEKVFFDDVEFIQDDEPYDEVETKESKNKHKKKQKKKLSKKKKIILGIVIALVAAVVALGIFMLVNFIRIKSDASDFKNQLFVAIDCIKTGDAEGANNAMESARNDAENISSVLNMKIVSLAKLIPAFENDINAANKLLEVFDDADEHIITPLIEMSKETPFSSIKSGDGIKIAAVNKYVDFAAEVAPKVEEYADELGDVRFKVINFGSINDYLEKIEHYAPLLENIDEYKTLLNVICGDGGDKAYFIMAQNTSEIRASGGFPGACGIMRIRDGVLDLTDFGPVRDYISYNTAGNGGRTALEGKIFGEDYLSQDRDACYNPHFPKVAEITKKSYEALTGGKIDGVISMTPKVIQDLLAATGETLVLDDGTEVNGSNAACVLQHDLYYKYYSYNGAYYNNDDIVDKLFAQTASLTIKAVKNNLDFSTLIGLLDVANSGFNDRTIMIWIDNEKAEEIIKQLGASGSVNYDENNPEAGIFFSNCIACKMGMYVHIDYKLSDPILNENGEQEYSVEVKFSNAATEADLDVAPYVKNYNGAVSGNISLFAPMKGKITDVKLDNDMIASYSKIYDLDVAYVKGVVMNPGESTTITYKITVPKGVTTPLKVVHTPTLQKYILRDDV